MFPVFAAAFVGTAIEGIEIALIVTAVGASRPIAAASGALVALLTIAIVAIVAGKLLGQADHSVYLKLGVAAVLIGFGIHFLIEAIH